MPRSTKSRQLAAQKAAAEQPVTIDQDATEEERAEYEEMLGEPVAHTPDWTVAPGATDQINPDVPTEVLATEGHTDVDVEVLVPVAVAQAVDVNELSETEIAALHARDFDWDSMRWAPGKVTNGGQRPCLCNRIAGGECDLNTKSRFSIGHDARFKGILQKAFRQRQTVKFSFVPEDNAVVTDAEGNQVRLSGEVDLEPEAVAKLVAPKLVKWIVHQSRDARLQIADAAAGTTVPQTAVEHKADEELTDADVEAQTDDAPDANFTEV
jgi:hypothetical protein